MGHFGLLTANEEGIVRIPQTIMGGSGNLVSFLMTQENSFDSLPLPSPPPPQARNKDQYLIAIRMCQARWSTSCMVLVVVLTSSVLKLGF